MTYMLLLNCALKLVEEIILYYDARSKKHQNDIKGIARCVEADHIFVIGQDQHHTAWHSHCQIDAKFVLNLLNG